MRLWTLLAAFTLILFETASVDAKYSEDCKIIYQNTGKKYEVTCLYISGSELNTATRSYKFSSFGLYAVIFWSEDQATIIKTSGFNSCGNEASKGCADSLFRLKGTDQEDRDWEICQPSHHFC